MCTLDHEPDIAEAEASLIGRCRCLSMGDRAGAQPMPTTFVCGESAMAAPAAPTHIKYRGGAFGMNALLRLLTCVSEEYDYRLAGTKNAGWQPPWMGANTEDFGPSRRDDVHTNVCLSEGPR